MRRPPTGWLTRSLLIAGASLAGLAAGSSAAARGGYHRAQAPPPVCGFVGGTLADPAETQRCLAERYKAARARRGAPPPTPPAKTPAPSGGAPS